MRGMLIVAMVWIVGQAVVLGAQEVAPLAVGQTVPDVTIRDAEGKSFVLRDALAKQPAVLIFYRGGWCPYCTKHLAALQAVEDQIVSSGYRILAISPDRPEKLMESEKSLGLQYELLSDSDMKAAKAFGLAFEVDPKTREAYKSYGIDLVEASGREHYMLPVPAVYVVDQQGMVQFVFAEEDYKVRLAPEKLLEILRPKSAQKESKTT